MLQHFRGEATFPMRPAKHNRQEMQTQSLSLSLSLSFRLCLPYYCTPYFGANNLRIQPSSRPKATNNSIYDRMAHPMLPLQTQRSSSKCAFPPWRPCVHQSNKCSKMRSDAQLVQLTSVLTLVQKARHRLGCLDGLRFPTTRGMEVTSKFSMKNDNTQQYHGSEVVCIPSPLAPAIDTSFSHGCRELGHSRGAKC